ncbi:heme biosynthesis protein HemY [Sanguibacter sp. HDW7]|uniref:heme biosynthesis protein HemY n=1 Tax=Sanguibacter sp. HDW7 TaxID=2714931 RepID=UPI00140CC485|nr:heme biosynthesis protein HemY [Sanguibacter sp. HDW7]QIK84531.1 heme biosynthesis protein HemY [Sanguibacter sp. HDW7]
MTNATSDGGPDPAARFRHLPEPVDLRDVVATVEVEAAPDPDGGRDANADWMLRHA